MDKVFIKGLEAHTTIGVFAWEQRQPRKLLFDLELSLDLQPAASSDDVTQTISYYEVAELVRGICAVARVQLLERLADQILQALFNRFACSEIRLVLHKPGAVPHAQSVGIEMVRRR